MSPDFIQPPVLLDPFSAESLKHTNLCNVHLYNDPFCQCNSVHSNVSSLPPGPRAFRIQLHPYSPVSAHLLVKAAVSSSSSFPFFLVGEPLPRSDWGILELDFLYRSGEKRRVVDGVVSERNPRLPAE